jgi:putative component of toxin-antitoxin plasmid stabilization module
MYIFPTYVDELNVRAGVREVILHARKEFCVYLVAERTLLLVLCDCVKSLYSQFASP